ncbi:hypothetical protein Acor_21730 [Acrocarpospora corrugata]|uniref:Uncharacterized protein n=1 Tax=Acrocarpospora corrugata TaxID=35763 RepID=A0A5M3VVY3_9ACTN|nr:hypothetical protein Acor_21730 [Acrocarpospora corrugata]
MGRADRTGQGWELGAVDGITVDGITVDDITVDGVAVHGGSGYQADPGDGGVTTRDRSSRVAAHRAPPPPCCFTKRLLGRYGGAGIGVNCLTLVFTEV